MEAISNGFLSKTFTSKNLACGSLSFFGRAVFFISTGTFDKIATPLYDFDQHYLYHNLVL